MPHSCNLHVNKKTSQTFEEMDLASKLKNKWINLILVSEDNMLCSLYFRSEKGIKTEKLRQIKSHSIIIHPLSKFRKFYECWLLLLNCLIIVLKPLDACVKDAGPGHCIAKNFKYQDRDMSFKMHVAISTLLDFLTLIDIFMNFITGYEIPHKKSIELNPKAIAKSYIKGPLFIIDLIGTIPRFTLRLFMTKPPLYILGIQNIFCLLKVLRVVGVVRLAPRVLTQWGLKSSTSLQNFVFIVVIMYTVHFVTVLNLGVVRIVRFYFGLGHCDRLLKMEQQEMFTLYPNYMFMTSGYLLSVSLPRKFYTNLNIEEYILLGVCYAGGKFVVATVWTVLAAIILNRKSKRIKYQTFIRQVEDYLSKKKVPMELRKRILEHYFFKHQGSHFKEDFINNLLSQELRKEVKIHLCSSLLHKVEIFKELTKEDLRDAVRVLVPEIILGGDVIIQAGGAAEYVYFLSSGTVALYTSTGQEICHYYDGAFFGEVCVAVKSNTRSITVIAIEPCQLFKMGSADFENIFLKYKIINKILKAKAKNLLRLANDADEEYNLRVLASNLRATRL